MNSEIPKLSYSETAVGLQKNTAIAKLMWGPVEGHKRHFKTFCSFDTCLCFLKPLLVTYLSKELIWRCFKFVQHKFSPTIELEYVKYSDRKMWHSFKSAVWLSFGPMV